MSIEKIIKKLLWFEDYNEEDYCGGDRIQDEYGDWFYKVTEEDFEAFRQAVDTMRNYQKITEIVKSWRENGLDYDSCDAMDNIERVIEDGKD